MALRKVTFPKNPLKDMSGSILILLSGGIKDVPISFKPEPREKFLVPHLRIMYRMDISSPSFLKISVCSQNRIDLSQATHAVFPYVIVMIELSLRGIPVRMGRDPNVDCGAVAAAKGRRT